MLLYPIVLFRESREMKGEVAGNDAHGSLARNQKQQAKEEDKEEQQENLQTDKEGKEVYRDI
jgi:hypothetical protein